MPNKEKDRFRLFYKCFSDTFTDPDLVNFTTKSHNPHG